jgi:hypothetical protein
MHGSLDLFGRTGVPKLGLMQNFTVTTTFDGRWWLYLIEELGILGQVKHRQDVREDARLCAALWVDAQPNAVHIGQVRYAKMHWSRLLPADQRPPRGVAVAANI